VPRLHVVCEVEPASEHPHYDKAVEVIIRSAPHKHRRMTQQYTVLSGTLDSMLTTPRSRWRGRDVHRETRNCPLGKQREWSRGRDPFGTRLDTRRSPSHRL